MVDKLSRFRPAIPTIPPVQPLRRLGEGPLTQREEFRNILEQEEIVFSSHARKRLEQRGISMNPAILEGLHQGMRCLEEKGGRDALLMMQDLAFVVNVPRRTVVTCIDSESRRGNVFTNIDSVVIVE
ncbi:MAG TPA: TIGR02530 family flagellar biosynthesis protein [Atribacteraceae bacterium]|nr:TIGR02530 family flagellar biosynthesis protein [Atribacteraceae bacterium]